VSCILTSRTNNHISLVNYFKHLRENSFRFGLGTTFLFNKVGPQAKLNGGGRR
jgi:hypothetical protein